MSRRLGMLLLALLGGCAEGNPSSYYEEPELDRVLDAFDLSASVAPTSIAFLAWGAPEPECAQAYRIDVQYEPGLSFEEANTGGLIVRRHARHAAYRATLADRTKGDDVELPDGPIPPDVIVPGELYYRGFRAERQGATRDFYLSSEFLGPASPMAGCFWRTWDPMEDTFTLGWPKLPARLTAVGEQWDGLRVQAQCSKSACVDENGAGGPDNHFRPCATGPLRERLAGLFDIEGERFALVRSTWSDGSDGTGISSERVALINVEHGRPVWAKAIIDYRFPQPTVNNTMEPIVRTWQMQAIDACPGSLAAAGWSIPDDLVAQAQMLAEQLHQSDAQRKSSRRKEGRRETSTGE